MTSIRSTTLGDLRWKLLDVKAMEPWDLVSLGFRSISSTVGRSLKQSLTFHSQRAHNARQTLCLVSQCLISPSVSGKAFCRVRMRQKVLYIWCRFLMPTIDVRLFGKSFEFILAKAVHEPDLVPETLICVFLLSDLYTR